MALYNFQGAVIPLGVLLDFVTAAFFDGLLVGSAVNLLVALISNSPESSASSVPPREPS